MKSSSTPIAKTPRAAALRNPHLSDLESLIKAGAISKGLIQQIVAGATVTLGTAIEQWNKWLTDVAGSDRTAICHHSYVSMWVNQARLSPAKTRLSDITTAHISNFINARDGTKVATRRARLAALRSFFKFCTIRNYLSFDPSREVRIKTKLLTHEQMEPAEKLCFTDDEIQAIDDSLMLRITESMTRLTSIEVSKAGCEKSLSVLAKLLDKVEKEISEKQRPEHLEKLKKTHRYLERRFIGTTNKLERLKHQIGIALETIKDNQFWRAAVGIGRWSGLRLGDICTIEKSSLAKPGKLIVWTDKKAIRVELPVCENLARAIALIPASNDKRFCFPEQARIHSDPRKRSKLSVQFMRILEGCGIEGKSFHCLRHTLATELNTEGESIEAIAKALGHTSQETTRGYIHQQTDTATGTIPR